MKQDVASTLSLSELLRPQSSGAPQQARANGASFDASLEKSLDSAKRTREALGFDRAPGQFDGNRPPQRPEHLRLDRQSFEDRVQDRIGSRRDDARQPLAGYQDRQRQLDAIQGTVDRLREYFQHSDAPNAPDGLDAEALPEGLDESQVAQLRALANGDISLDELTSEELASLEEALSALGDALGITLDLETLVASKSGFFDALQGALAQATNADDSGDTDNTSSDNADDLTPELSADDSADTPDATLTVEKTDGKSHAAHGAAATSTPATEAPLGKASAAKADGDAERIQGKQAGKATPSSAKPDTPATAGANVANQTEDTDVNPDTEVDESTQAADEVTNDDTTSEHTTQADAEGDAPAGEEGTPGAQNEATDNDTLDTHQRHDQHAHSAHGTHAGEHANGNAQASHSPSGTGAAQAAAGSENTSKPSESRRASAATGSQGKTDADVVGKYTSNVVESDTSQDSDTPSSDGESAESTEQSDTPEGEVLPVASKPETAPAPLEEAKLGTKLSLLEQSQHANTSAPESSVEKGTAATRSLRNAGPVGLDNSAKVINFTARESQPTTQSSEAKHVVKMANQQAMIDKITSNLRMMVGRNQSMIRMDLNPPELGKMTMRLNLRNDQLHAHLKVHSIEARELIGSNLDQLRDTLAKQGVDVHSVSVDVDTHEGRGEAFTRQYRWQAQQHANKTSFGQFLNGSEEMSSSTRAASIMQADRLDLIA